MSFADQPAPHGATKIDYRANEKTAYVFHAYPSCRYHPDGRMVLVKNEGEDKACPPPWRDTPYPQPEKVAPPPEPTLDELKAENARLAEANGTLKLERDAFERENLDMKAYIAEQLNQAEAKASKTEQKRQAGNKPKTDAA